MERRRWWRGLQARVALAYALGALVLFSAAAYATFFLAQRQLLSQTEAQHRVQTFQNARDISERVENIDPDTVAEDTENDGYISALNDLSRPNGSSPILILEDGSPRSLILERTDIPKRLEVVVEGRELEIAQMRSKQNGTVNYWIGIYLPSVKAAYYEKLPLTELEATLGLLRVILVGVTVTSSLLGAGLGYYTAHRALAPLPKISGAARAIAAGDFTTKLDLQADPDLGVLTLAFNDMVDAVGERIAREQRFTSNVSHELRSPLMTLTASVEVLERRKESLPTVVQQAIDLLSHDLVRFQRLVEDLLEISRMEAGAVQLQLGRFGLAEFLENVIFVSQHPQIELIPAADNPELAVTADKRRLAQVMTNLIENADKYGGGATFISFSVKGDRVEIAVVDEGSGVAAEERERIFERFGRIDTTAGNRSKATGFGLGLSLVREHIRLHDGRVWVTDRKDGGRGARFVVELPIGEHIDLMEDFAE